MTLTESAFNEISDLHALTEKVKEYISKAKSPSTRKAYRSDWRDFEYWCSLKGLNALPAQTATVAAYLTDRASSSWSDKNGKLWEPLKVASLERRLVAIRQAHAMAGFPFNKGDALIVSTMQGIKNMHGAPQTSKAPILLDDLRAMISHLEYDLASIRDRALLLLGFTGAFRRSELVSLKIEDLNFKKEGIQILLRRSKVDQAGEGSVIPIPYGSNPETCPVRSIELWLEQSHIKEGYIFRAINKHGHISERGLCAASVGLIIKRNRHIKARAEEFSGHSLRAGFCTQAAIRGASEHSIMRQSRHKKNDTVKKYIRIANMWQDCAATKLGL